jgi:hypothetical protein
MKRHTGHIRMKVEVVYDVMDDGKHMCASTCRYRCDNVCILFPTMVNGRRSPDCIDNQEEPTPAPAKFTPSVGSTGLADFVYQRWQQLSDEEK